MDDIKTVGQLVKAYNNGTRLFEGWDFGDGGDFRELNLRGSTFINCFFYGDFRCANLSDCSFISSNLKTCIFDEADLTGTSIKDCALESSSYIGAKLNDTVFQNSFSYNTSIDIQKLIEMDFKL